MNIQQNCHEITQKPFSKFSQIDILIHQSSKLQKNIEKITNNDKEIKITKQNNHEDNIINKNKEFYQIKVNIKSQSNQAIDNVNISQKEEEDEITLLKFDNQKLIKQIKQEFFEQELKKYPLNERKFFIIDRNNLKIIDTREQNSIKQFIKKSLVNTSKSTLITNNINHSNTTDNFKSTDKDNLLEDHQINTNFKRKRIVSSQLNKSSIWQDHWKQSNKVHESFLSAICKNNFVEFNKLLNKRENPIPIEINFRSESNWCPIHYAAMHCSSNIVSRLINHPQIDVNVLTDYNWTPLHIAVQSNKYDNCELLIHAGVCIDYKDNDHSTALHFAAELGYKTIIQLLIKNGASELIKNSKGMTPREVCQSQQLLRLFTKEDQEENAYGARFFKLKRNAFVERMITSSPQNTGTTDSSSTHNISYNQSETHSMVSKNNIPNSGGKKNQKQKKVEQSSKQNDQAIKTATDNRKNNIFKMYQLIINKKSEPITLSTFRFYKKIGQGAFGEVYVVRKQKSDKLYALKAIKKQRVIGTALYRYIQTEKQILSCIAHPFVVRLNCAFQTQAYLFLVMDYCQGGDMSRLLEKKQRLEQKIAKMYAAEILLGLEALHKNMIIYRDLKPENIVLDKDGHACITDFGLSKKTNDLDAVNKSFCGTPAYLPLEIINKKGHTRMADWYQYGIVLYELMTGIPPFYADTKTQLYDKVRAGVIRFPKHSSETFRDLIKKLLAQNPQKRLGFENDAQSIKQHEWFKDIDWDQVYERRLPVPPIMNKTKIPSDPIKTKFADIKSQKYFIPSWSFIS